MTVVIFGYQVANHIPHCAAAVTCYKMSSKGKYEDRSKQPSGTEVVVEIDVVAQSPEPDHIQYRGKTPY